MEKDNKLNSDEDLPGYPTYPEGEDIYSNLVKEENVDPDQVSERILPDMATESHANPVNDYDAVGSELDVPGTELDDTQENIGTEDEENNYYSLGGDSHENLDENS